MLCFPVPANESARVAALGEYDIDGLDSPPVLDEITRLAADLLDVPICLVSFVGEKEQWLKSRHGTDISCTPRGESFCTHTIVGPDPLIVLDAHDDERFRANPYVVGAPYVRFYAGVPLVSDDGFAIGALCVIDTVPRSGFSDRDLDILGRLAGLVMADLGHRRQARVAARASQLRQWRENKCPAARAEAVQTARARLDQIFDAEISTRHVFDILLELFAASMEGRRVTVTACCRASRAPKSTALRSLAEMVQQGLAHQTRDNLDRRKIYVQLTTSAADRMRQWLDELPLFPAQPMTAD